MSNEALAPWSNRLDDPALGGLRTQFDAWDQDPDRRVVLAQSGLPPIPATRERVLVMAGTDVSGPLHVGHLYDFLVAAGVAARCGGELVVTLNEPESVLSRSASIGEALGHRAVIVDTLDRHGVGVHRRLADQQLLLLALMLFRELAAAGAAEAVEAHYGSPLGAADLLSVCVMAAVPAALARAREASWVVAVYGCDELPHLSLMEELYRADWFSSLARRGVGACPRFGFVATRLVPCADDGLKMSKTLPEHTVPFDGLPGSLPPAVERELDRAVAFAAESGLASDDPLFRLAASLIPATDGAALR